MYALFIRTFSKFNLNCDISRYMALFLITIFVNILTQKDNTKFDYSASAEVCMLWCSELLDSDTFGAFPHFQVYFKKWNKNIPYRNVRLCVKHSQLDAVNIFAHTGIIA